LKLKDIELEIIVGKAEQKHFTKLMQEHHYLGRLPKIGNTLWYVAKHQNQWVALISFSASALKCKARDSWIGWSHRYQYDRLHLIANNSRFLILPEHHRQNLASKVLSLCEKRISHDWQKNFGYPLLLLETFVDPQYFHGTIYKATNWIYVGNTQGYSRTRKGTNTYTVNSLPKKVFLKSLTRQTPKLLSTPILKERYTNGEPKFMLSAKQMTSLPGFFNQITDPRTKRGRQHTLSNILALTTAAVLCGMQGYKAISSWACDLSQQARERFKCRKRDGYYFVPSTTTFRETLIRLNPDELELALQQWNLQFAAEDEGLAVDGKTMRAAIADNGKQVHILGVVGHQTTQAVTKKK